MLLNNAELELIRAGAVSLVFRRWRRPNVKPGGTLTTAIGVLAIDAVDAITQRDITDDDAHRAGHADRRSLLDTLRGREGTLYRIAIRYAGEDPRIALRNDDRLSAAELDRTRARLARLDAASRVGPWTLRVLKAIERHPNLAAIRLAEMLGYEKAWLKLNIRKLKNLGLTISHQPGYELSPRGSAVVRAMRN